MSDFFDVVEFSATKLLHGMDCKCLSNLKQLVRGLVVIVREPVLFLEAMESDRLLSYIFPHRMHLLHHRHQWTQDCFTRFPELLTHCVSLTGRVNEATNLGELMTLNLLPNALDH